MSKTCKDFAEVLLALGQGEIVIDADDCRIRIKGNDILWASEDMDNWDLFSQLDPEDFNYPAPIYEGPKTVEVDMWLNVYQVGGTTKYKTRDAADRAAGHDRIACINIKRTVTEGEGL